MGEAMYCTQATIKHTSTIHRPKPECTNYVAHTLIQGTTYKGLYCTVYYSTQRPGPAPKMELCLIDWRGVWSQPYHTLTYLPSLLSQKNLLNIPKRQFLNVMSYLCQIQVTKHIWLTFMGMMNCTAVSIKPVQTESINYQVQLKNPAFKVCSVQKGRLLCLLGILIRPLRKKSCIYESLYNMKHGQEARLKPDFGKYMIIY